jgi:hypothetical protein
MSQAMSFDRFTFSTSTRSHVTVATGVDVSYNGAGSKAIELIEDFSSDGCISIITR